MQAGTLLYQGKVKTILTSQDPDLFVMRFSDNTTALDGERLEQLPGKARLNNLFNAFIMQYLQQAGIPCHFVKILDECDCLVKRLEMLPIENVLRNRAAGGLVRRLGVAEGLILNPPVLEYFLKNDALHDPLVHDSLIETFGWANKAQMLRMRELTLQVNAILSPLFALHGMILVDYKLEFGLYQGEILLGDEFTLDGCRVWDSQSLEKLDKDRFRRNLGGVMEAYQEVSRRLGIIE